VRGDGTELRVGARAEEVWYDGGTASKGKDWSTFAGVMLERLCNREDMSCSCKRACDEMREGAATACSLTDLFCVCFVLHPPSFSA